MFELLRLQSKLNLQALEKDALMDIEDIPCYWNPPEFTGRCFDAGVSHSASLYLRSEKRLVRVPESHSI